MQWCTFMLVNKSLYSLIVAISHPYFVIRFDLFCNVLAWEGVVLVQCSLCMMNLCSAWFKSHYTLTHRLDFQVSKQFSRSRFSSRPPTRSKSSRLVLQSIIDIAAHAVCSPRDVNLKIRDDEMFIVSIGRKVLNIFIDLVGWFSFCMK